MTHLHPTPLPQAPLPAAPQPRTPGSAAPGSAAARGRAPAWPCASGQPAGHLVCDPHGRVCWTDDIAERLLAGAQVLLLQADGRLGVRSHRLGLLALRSAMRLAVLGGPAAPITLRHGRDELRVGVHALPEAADGSARVLLSLRPAEPQLAAGAAHHNWSANA